MTETVIEVIDELRVVELIHDAPVIEVLQQDTVVEVIDAQPVIDVVDQSTVVELSAAGPRGERGPAGAPGGTAHEHVQESASTTWTINHNLGFRPTVELRTTGGHEFWGEVQHTSDNQVVIHLNSPLAGSARLI